MQKTKQFTQFSDDSFSISVKIGIECNVVERNIIKTYGDYSRQKNKIWNKNNKEYIKKWNKDNKYKIKEGRHEYYINNKEEILKGIKKYRKTTAGKISTKRGDSKRRKFGFKPLNDWFKGSHFHHLHINNHDDGIFMPGYIHNGIWHDPNNKESMIKINKLAFEYLENQKCD